jgi:hypothetical protein
MQSNGVAAVWKCGTAADNYTGSNQGLGIYKPANGWMVSLGIANGDVQYGLEDGTKVAAGFQGKCPIVAITIQPDGTVFAHWDSSCPSS